MDSRWPLGKEFLTYRFLLSSSDYRSKEKYNTVITHKVLKALLPRHNKKCIKSRRNHSLKALLLHSKKPPFNTKGLKGLTTKTIIHHKVNQQNDSTPTTNSKLPKRKV